jgi:hypothetical protein
MIHLSNNFLLHISNSQEVLIIVVDIFCEDGVWFFKKKFLAEFEIRP